MTISKNLPVIWQAYRVAGQLWSPEKVHGSERAAEGPKRSGCRGWGSLGNHGDGVGHSVRLQSWHPLSTMVKGQSLFYADIFLAIELTRAWYGGLVQNSQDTSMTVAGAVWVSAKRRRLWRSLSSAAFLAVALMCATVTCQKDRIHGFRLEKTWTCLHTGFKPLVPESCWALGWQLCSLCWCRKRK